MRLDKKLNKQVTIAANDKLALDTVWAEAGYWISSEVGEYRVYAALLDENDEVIKDLQGNNLEASWEFRVS